MSRSQSRTRCMTIMWNLSKRCRCFGREGASARVRKLRCVWISHRHADHHVGLPHLLSTRAAVFGSVVPPIPVFGPFPLRRVLSACNRMEPLHYTWHDQYGLCPRGEGEGRDLEFFWENAGCAGVAAAAQRVCEVRLSFAHTHCQLGVNHICDAMLFMMALRIGRIHKADSWPQSDSVPGALSF